MPSRERLPAYGRKESLGRKGTRAEVFTLYTEERSIYSAFKKKTNTENSKTARNTRYKLVYEIIADSSVFLLLIV